MSNGLPCVRSRFPCLDPDTWSALQLKSYAAPMRTYTPAEAARESGLSLDTLRYYEREGILPGVERSGGGQRRYSEENLATLGFLRCLRETGMPISLLRRYGRLCRDETTLPERIELLAEHAQAVAEQIATLRSRQQRLNDKLEWYQGELARRGASAAARGGLSTRRAPSVVARVTVLRDRARPRVLRGASVRR